VETRAVELLSGSKPERAVRTEVLRRRRQALEERLRRVRLFREQAGISGSLVRDQREMGCCLASERRSGSAG